MQRLSLELFEWFSREVMIADYEMTVAHYYNYNSVAQRLLSRMGES